jgi:hypothetical protein
MIVSSYKYRFKLLKKHSSTLPSLSGSDIGDISLDTFVSVRSEKRKKKANAFCELDNSSSSQFYSEELKFTQRLGLHQFEYDGHVRAGVLANYLIKTKAIWYIGTRHLQNGIIKIRNAMREKEVILLSQKM